MSSQPNYPDRPAQKVAFMGLLFALAIALSFLEGLLPALPMLPPGIKLGLSNIVTMYALFFLGRRQGILIAILKSLFVLFWRGPVGAALSLSGGLASVLAMSLLFLLGSKDNRPGLGYTILSIAGAVMHNIGQLALSVVIIGSGYVLYYLPVMMIAGIVVGMVTGITVKVLAPYFEKLKMKF